MTAADGTRLDLRLTALFDAGAHWATEPTDRRGYGDALREAVGRATTPGDRDRGRELAETTIDGPDPRLPALWWSSTRGVIQADEDAYSTVRSAGWTLVAHLPDDAVRLDALRAPARPADEDELHFLDANEKLGDALTEVGMILGLAKPRTGATWGAREVIERAHAVVEWAEVDRATSKSMARRVVAAGADHENDTGETEGVSSAVGARGGEAVGCDCPFGPSPTGQHLNDCATLRVPVRVEIGAEETGAGVWRSPDGTLTIRPEDTASDPVFIDEHFLPPGDAVELVPRTPAVDAGARGGERERELADPSWLDTRWPDLTEPQRTVLGAVAQAVEEAEDADGGPVDVARSALRALASTGDAESGEEQ